MGQAWSPGEVAAAVAGARVGRLATIDRAGRPHLVPCCFALARRSAAGRGDVAYTAVDGKPKSTAELKRLDNIQANPAVTLLVDHYDDDWSRLWWVRLDGDARVISGGPERDAAIDLLVAKYAQYRQQRPQGAVIAIDVQRFRSWRP